MHYILTRLQWKLITSGTEASNQCKRCMKLQIAMLQEELQKMRQKSAMMVTLDEFHDMKEKGLI